MADKKASRAELLAQYEQIRHDIREYNRSVWQTPGAALAIETGFLTLALSSSSTQCARAGITLAGTLLVLGLLVTFVKHAHYQVLKSNAARVLGSQLGLSEEHFPGVLWTDTLKKIEEDLQPRGIRGLLSRQSAVVWLARFLYIVTLLNIAILIASSVGCLESACYGAVIR